jgi:Fe-S-cluster-containing hydrogenase component 2
VLKDILDEKKCFKLICGAGNEDLEEVEKLVALYAKAGCKLFDLNASEEVLYAAEKGLNYSIPKENQKDYNFCISVGTKNDFHLKKAKINPDICKKCGKCVGICLQKAINSDFQIDSKKCIGCLRCVDICPYKISGIFLKK